MKLYCFIIITLLCSSMVHNVNTQVGYGDSVRHEEGIGFKEEKKADLIDLGITRKLVEAVQKVLKPLSPLKPLGPLKPLADGLGKKTPLKPKPKVIGKPGGIKIVPQSVCLMKADPGYCNLIIGRWYYDYRYHRCLPFLYTGCGGNLNNFGSIKTCTAATHQCHFFNSPLDPLTKHALLNPVNPLSSLAHDFVLGR